MQQLLSKLTVCYGVGFAENPSVFGKIIVKQSYDHGILQMAVNVAVLSGAQSTPPRRGQELPKLWNWILIPFFPDKS